jgi:hypothetical protein
MPMEKQAIIINCIVVFLLMIVNVSDLRCQEPVDTLDIQYQSNNIKSLPIGAEGEDLKDNKNLRVEILEIIIKHQLLYEYQKVDSRELEDRLERGR